MTTAAAVATLAAGLLLASPRQALAAGSSCAQLQLSATSLCVSVQSNAASVHPGGTAGYVVEVSVENGFALGAYVSLSGTGGDPVFTSGCPSGEGTATCSITSLNFLGSASSYQLAAQIPAGAGVSSVTLTATASVPQLPGWTPPSASSTVAVVTPPADGTPAARPSSSAPGPQTPSSTRPGGSGTGGSGTGGSGTGGRPPGKGGGPSGSGGIGIPGSGQGGGSRGAGQDVGAPGPVPLPLDTAPGAIATVGAGNASGLFPKISPSPAGQRPLRAIAAATPVGGFPMVIVAVIAGTGAMLAWLAVALLPRYRRRTR